MIYAILGPRRASGVAYNIENLQIIHATTLPAGQLRWRCKACRGDFSIALGTLFSWHKLPLRTYLLAVAGFCNEVKGKSMLAFSRELDVPYKRPLCWRTSCARPWRPA